MKRRIERGTVPYTVNYSFERARIVLVHMFGVAVPLDPPNWPSNRICQTLSLPFNVYEDN